MTSNIKLLLIYLFSAIFSLLILCISPQLLAYENSADSLKHIKTAKLYIDQGLPEKAETELEAGLKTDPKSPDLLNNLGTVYLRMGQSHKGANKRCAYLEKARDYFTQAIDTDANFPSAWNGLADTYYLGGHSQQAIYYYKKALSLTPKRAYELLTNLANAQRDSGLQAEAQESYQKAIELNPIYAPAHNGYAELLLNKHDFVQAYGEILEAIRLKPTYATAYYHLGLIESARGNKTEALKAYLLSLRYEKNSAYAQETQTLINNLGLNSNSVSFEELRKFQSELCHSLFLPQAEIEHSKLTKDLPETDNRKVASTMSAIPCNKATIRTIESLIANKQWSKAQKEVSKMLRIYPDEPVLFNELGLILLNQKKYQESGKVLIQAISKSHNSLSAAYYNLGQVYLAQYNLVKAQPVLERAKLLTIKNSGNSALIDNSLAILFRQKGNWRAAHTAYTQALETGGNDFPVIHYNFAILLEQMNKPKEAKQEFNAYLGLSPRGINALSAQNHLKKLNN
jgi:tetratricopeptide (TPR) repeat protein